MISIVWYSSIVASRRPGPRDPQGHYLIDIQLGAQPQ